MGEESLPHLVLILTFSSSVCGAFGLQITSKLPLLMLLAQPSPWTALYGTQEAARSRLSGEWLTWLVPRQPGLRPLGISVFEPSCCNWKGWAPDTANDLMGRGAVWEEERENYC